MVAKKTEQVKSIKSSGNVFADLGIPEPDKYLVKAKLAFQINNILKRKTLKQSEVAEILGIDQLKVWALSRGLLDDFSIERLIDFLNRLDRDVEIVVKTKQTRRKTHEHLSVVFA